MMPVVVTTFLLFKKKIVQKWFNGFSNGSIISFLQLAESFNAHFIASKRERKINIHFTKIQQAKGENLKRDVMRFNQEGLLLLDLHDGVAFMLFSMGCFQKGSTCSSSKAKGPL